MTLRPTSKASPVACTPAAQFRRVARGAEGRGQHALDGRDLCHDPDGRGVRVKEEGGVGAGDDEDGMVAGRLFHRRSPRRWCGNLTDESIKAVAERCSRA